MPIETVVATFATYGYPAIFLIAFFEGPAIAILAGVLIGLHILQLVPSFLVLMAGDIVADAFYYVLGRWGHETVLPRLRRFITVSDAALTRLVQQYHTRGSEILVLGKLHWSPLPVGVGILIAAGMAHMPFGRFMLINAVASSGKIILFLAIGYMLGSHYPLVTSHPFLTGIVFSLVGGLGFYAYWKYKHRSPRIDKI